VNYSYHIVIGGDLPADCLPSESLLIRLPGEFGPVDANTIAPKTLDECLLFLRHRYADHPSIASLAGTRIVADHPIEGSDDIVAPLTSSKSPAAIRKLWHPAIEGKLAELLDDLGNCMMDSWRGALHVIKNGAAISASPSSRELMYAHAGETALVIGSGPSASDYFADILRIRKGVRIFCADTILTGLLSAGIVPDYVCAIEREPAITKVLSAHGKCGATLIASPVIEPECVANWAGNTLFWHGADDLYRWIDPAIEGMPSGRSAGSLAVAAALHAGCAYTYLVGHDLSYRNGASHSVQAHPLAHLAAQKAVKDAHPADIHHQRMQVEANHGGTVESSGLWNLVRGDIEGIIANHPRWRVFNVCDYNGARIAGAPVGSLPTNPMTLDPRKRLPASGIVSPAERLPELRASLMRATGALESVRGMLTTGAKLDDVADSMRASCIFGQDNAILFQYITRALYGNLVLRLHLDKLRGIPRDESTRNVLEIAVNSISAIVDLMKIELP
jgi:hypothetical protein